jgi:hypothetical protein
VSRERFERVRKVPLFTDIAAALCVKLLALCVLYFLFFSAPPPIDARAIASHLTGAADGHR